MRELFELYNVSENYLANIECLLADEDLSPEIIANTIEAMGGDIEEKAINLASYIKNLDISAEAISRAIDDLDLRYHRVKTKSDKLKTALKNVLSRCNIKKISSPYFDIKIKNNPPRVQYDNESDIPAEFWIEKISRSPRIAELKEAIKNGQEFPGIRLINDTSITIK